MLRVSYLAAICAVTLPAWPRPTSIALLKERQIGVARRDMRGMRSTLVKLVATCADPATVALSRRSRRVQSALRDVVMRLCAAGGLLVGLLVGINAEPGTPAHCATENCLSEGLMAGLLPVMLPALGGLIIGAVVGMILAHLIRLEHAPKPRIAKATLDDRRITARYPGVCAGCGGGVEPGDRIVHSRTTKATWCTSCEPA